MEGSSGWLSSSLPETRHGAQLLGAAIFQSDRHTLATRATHTTITKRMRESPEVQQRCTKEMARTKPSECQPLPPEVLGALSACLPVICLHSDRRRKPSLPRGFLPSLWASSPFLVGFFSGPGNGYHTPPFRGISCFRGPPW